MWSPQDWAHNYNILQLYLHTDFIILTVAHLYTTYTYHLDFVQAFVELFKFFFQGEDLPNDEASLMTTADLAEISQSKQGLGVTYTRWGNDKCPTGVRLLYSRTMAGSHYSHQGGGANSLCLPEQPDYTTLNTNTKRYSSLIYGTEYEYPIIGTHDHDVPCAVCYVRGRSAKENLMIPAITTCPRGWNREYYGYIMTSLYSDNGRSEFLCIDKDQKSLPGSAGNQNGALLYHVRATCTGIHCPPYDSGKALTCVVCSK